MTAGHCCLGSVAISVNISAYSYTLGANPLEKGVLQYAAEDDETPKVSMNQLTGSGAQWDVCIVELPQYADKIEPAPLGEAHVSMHVNALESVSSQHRPISPRTK